MNYEKRIDDRIEKEIDSFSWKKTFKYLLISVLALCVVGLVLSFASSAMKVATAPAKILSKTLETDNIINSYEWFFDVNAQYEARMGQVKQFKSFYEREEDSSEKQRLRIDMSAVQQSCRDLTEKYNADSQKMNKSIFKGWSLPDYLNQSTCE